MIPPDYPARPRRNEDRAGRREEKTVRAFAAVFPPESVLRELEALRERLLPAVPGLRWVASRNLHFTLRFFGNLSETEVEKAGGALEAVAPHCAPFDLALSGLGVFPGWKRPRVLWVGAALGGNTLEALARTLEREFRAVRLGKADKPFRAHLTVGRWREPPGESAERARSVCEEVGEIATFRVEEARIMRSTLGPGGPTYRALHQARLGG
jgi:2'-5' RNA ligase